MGYMISNRFRLTACAMEAILARVCLKISYTIPSIDWSSSYLLKWTFGGIYPHFLWTVPEESRSPHPLRSMPRASPLLCSEDTHCARHDGVWKKKEFPCRFLELMRGIKQYKTWYDHSSVGWLRQVYNYNVIYKKHIIGRSHFIGFEEPQRNPT